jgi:acyl-CoA thioester hydrolase
MTRHSTTQPFNYITRIYYEDTDAAGVVYYANYLKFAERARTDTLRSLGVEQFDLYRDHGLAFVITRCEIDYKKPARLDDEISVHTELHELGKVRMTMHQRIHRKNEILAELVVKLACVNKDGKPTAWPDFLDRTLRQLLV